MAVACPAYKESWFALKVRARAELTASDLLLNRGFEVFCPTYRDHRKYSDRIKKVEAGALSRVCLLPIRLE